jgi:putative flippase GtrA
MSQISFAMALQIAASALRYFAGACCGLVLDWTVFMICYRLSGCAAGAQAAGKLAGCVAGFFIYRHAVFRASGEAPAGQACRFAVAGLGGVLTGVALVCVLKNVMHPVHAKLFSDALTFCINFVTMRTWVFRSASSA